MFAEAVVNSGVDIVFELKPQPETEIVEPLGILEVFGTVEHGANAAPCDSAESLVDVLPVFRLKSQLVAVDISAHIVPTHPDTIRGELFA